MKHETVSMEAVFFFAAEARGEKVRGTFARPCHIFCKASAEAKYEQGVQIL